MKPTNTLEDGTRFSFNYEIIFGYAILEVIHAPTWGTRFLFSALGYDRRGRLSNNRPFIYPAITRADVDKIKITNQYGSYTAYSVKNGAATEFFFEGAEFCQYDQEKFASFIVNCTYMLSFGKISNPSNLSDYGLGSEEEASAIIEINTTDGKYHKINR